MSQRYPGLSWAEWAEEIDGWSDLRVMAGCQCPARNNVPKTAVPSPTCHFSPTNAAMPGLGVTVINSSLMAKLSGPIPVCLLSCKTFPWLAREQLGGKGKRPTFQNINLPLPLLPANLPANRLKERKPTLRTEPGVGAAHCISACSQPLSFQQEEAWEGQLTFSCPGPYSLHTEEETWPSQGDHSPFIFGD